MNHNIISKGQEVAIRFAQALVEHDYQSAYVLTTPSYQVRVQMKEVQEHFERIIPDDWGPMEMWK